LPEARALNQPAAAAAEVFVDDDNAGETQLPGAVSQCVLTLPTFAMHAHLLLR
jgi:hypothetical protein